MLANYVPSEVKGELICLMPLATRNPGTAKADIRGKRKGVEKALLQLESVFLNVYVDVPNSP